MAADDAAQDFKDALSARLADASARSLAARSYWGRTVVSEIKSGRRLPTPKQLDALLAAVDAPEAERAEWARRLAATDFHGGTSDDSPPASAGRVGRQMPRVRILGVVVVAAVVVAILVLSGVVIGMRIARVGPVATPSASTVPTAGDASDAASPAPTGIRGTILTPADGTEVSASAGARLEGTLNSELPGTFWLLDLDPDGTYTVDLPVTEEGSAWSANDQPIGDAGDIRSSITVVLVYADGACESKLSALQDSSDPSLIRLPSGCTAVDHVDLIIARR